MMRRMLLAVLFLCAVVLYAHGPAEAGEGPCLTSFFTKSLHFSGKGMRYWYEEPNGFMSITGIPYNQLGCKKCHATSCDACHMTQKGEKKRFSKRAAKSMNTCMACHSREGLTFKLDGRHNQLDVHVAAGMVCSDCHYRSDVHGDGRERTSMRHPKAVRATCEECHVQQERESPAYDPDTPSHSAHGGKLACAACHVTNTMSCYNCHFGAFLKTGQKKGNFLPEKSWMLLINYNGQVTSGNVMSLVYKNRPFVAYVPYFTHSISAQGRRCDDCHGNAAVQRMVKGEKVPVMRFENGTLIPWQGVVPTIPNKLDWVYLDKTPQGWRPLQDAQPAKIQFAAYGQPMTEKQLEALAQKPQAKQ
ncbi:hypothetical protein SAMN02746041_00407 [Desulfacinum hydrothermale DSM 13146]|uniref:Uncharacterized protein n=1 Tax=Desulfacinum hydrothermale DSM 13146 TaxID=1121390 RepID=A0A1W1X1Q5_9BACT|nr:hypothetical protein [Desulfacinum hydrothermale]SMC17827.1 hypothetical protein SAMN02746041_00407 [Desulfacinum hydrothermale DSM 13146]